MRTSTIISPFAVALILLMHTTSATAQIEIPDSNVTDTYGKTMDMVLYESASADGVQALVDMTGADQVWDFSFSWTDSTIFRQRVIPLPADVPGADDPRFDLADHVVESILYPDPDGVPDTARVFIYRQLSGGMLFTIGTVTVGDIDDDGVDDAFPQYQSPPSLQVMFPVQFGAAWEDSTALITRLNGTDYVSNIRTSTTDVVGWGTIMTQFGDSEVLRTDRTERSTIPGSGLTTQDFDLEFVGNDGLTAEIDLNEDGTPRSASVTVMKASSGSETPVANEDLYPDAGQNGVRSVFPNPFSDRTRIRVNLSEPGRFELVVHDILGRRVAHLEGGTRLSGIFDMEWDGTGDRGSSPAGIYVISGLLDGRQIATQLISKID